MRYFAGGDLAFKSDFATLVIVGRDGDDYSVTDVEEQRPERGKPLVPSKVCATFAETMGRRAIESIAVDGHYIESAREHFGAAGISVVEAPAGNAGKVATYLGLRTLVNEARIRVTQRDLVAQLKKIQKRPLPGGGMDIQAPRRKRAGHGDAVSALVLAVWMARDWGGDDDGDLLEQTLLLQQRARDEGFGFRDWGGGRGF